jgi:GGDEF domain-containing protein
MTARRIGQNCGVTGIGIATGTGHADANEIRVGADDAMYRAKQCGGRSYELAPSTLVDLGAG